MKSGFLWWFCLRILYQLDRFSEDLDFSLLPKKPHFSLEPYNRAIQEELKACGFSVEVLRKEKTAESKIQSAFIKPNTKEQLLVIHADKSIAKKIHAMDSIKIKMEVDTEMQKMIFYLLFKTQRL